MSYIEEALAKARKLAAQAKSRPSGGGGLAAAGEARATQGTLATRPQPGGLAVPHMSRAQAEGRRLFIGGLSYDTTDQSLEEYLSSKWACEEAKVKRDPEGKSRGFAFVTFPVVSILEDCFNAQPHWIDGKQVELRKVAPDGSSATAGQKRAHSGVTHYGGGSSTTSTRVFIGQAPGGRSRGLNDDIGDDDLRTFFERYGTVTGIAQHRWEDSGRKKGFGYMEFAEYEAAQAALGIHTVNGVLLEVKPYTQGGLRKSEPQQYQAPAPPPTYNTAGVSSDYGYGSGGAGYGYGYGSDNKRSRTDLPPLQPPPPPSNPPPSNSNSNPNDPAAMMEQMKSMMTQMQQMQQQMQGNQNPSNSLGDQMQQMQQTMYSMMQNMSQTSSNSHPPTPSYPNYPGYPTQQPYQYPSTIEYPKPPKPPGTDRY